jgi:hypothetical protein
LTSNIDLTQDILFSDSTLAPFLEPILGAESGCIPLYVPSIDTLDDHAIAPAINFTSETEKFFAESELPGTQHDCGLDNGAYARMISCSKDPTHSHYEWGGTSCGRVGCPRHWRTWVHRAADRVACRVEGYLQVNPSYPSRHIILSLDPENPFFARVEKYPPYIQVRKLRRYFVERAEELGMTGGALAIHLWRTNDKVPKLKDKKKWDWVRDHGDKWRDYVYFSPHAHIIGYGYLPTPKKGEFLYKNKGKLRTREDVYRAARYALSHTSIVEYTDAVIYFGECSYRKLKQVSAWRVPRDLACEVCGAPMTYDDCGDVVTVRHLQGEFIRANVDPPDL